MDMLGAVPLNGFWNTRPMSFARRCSGQRVMFWPASMSLPASAMNVPATALSRVDLPEPFVPMMRRNEPRSSRSETSRNARTSLGVPGLNVLVMLVISSISDGGWLRIGGWLELAQQRRGDQRHEHKRRGDELQIVGVQAPP